MGRGGDAVGRGNAGQSWVLAAAAAWGRAHAPPLESSRGQVVGYAVQFRGLGRQLLPSGEHRSRCAAKRSIVGEALGVIWPSFQELELTGVFLQWVWLWLVRVALPDGTQAHKHDAMPVLSTGVHSDGSSAEAVRHCLAESRRVWYQSKPFLLGRKVPLEKGLHMFDMTIIMAARCRAGGWTPSRLHLEMLLERA